jgi:DNA-binding MarR family transcriptional regulator
MSLMLPPLSSGRPPRGSEPLDPAALAASRELLRAAEEIHRAMEIHAQGRFGLSRGRLELLLALADGPAAGLRPALLADRLGVSRATVTALLDGLESAGLVARRAAPRDRRARDVTLTAAGRARAREIAPAHARRLGAVTRTLTEDERTRLAELLAKVRAGLGALRGP